MMCMIWLLLPTDCLVKCHTCVSPLSPPTVTLSVTGVVMAVVVASSSTRLMSSVVGEGSVVCVTLAQRDVVCMVDR